MPVFSASRLQRLRFLKSGTATIVGSTALLTGASAYLSLRLLSHSFIRAGLLLRLADVAAVTSLLAGLLGVLLGSMLVCLSARRWWRLLLLLPLLSLLLMNSNENIFLTGLALGVFLCSPVLWCGALKQTTTELDLAEARGQLRLAGLIFLPLSGLGLTPHLFSFGLWRPSSGSLYLLSILALIYLGLGSIELSKHKQPSSNP